jgi:hypothetical protein
MLYAFYNVVSLWIHYSTLKGQQEEKFNLTAFADPVSVKKTIFSHPLTRSQGVTIASNEYGQICSVFWLPVW